MPVQGHSIAEQENNKNEKCTITIVGNARFGQVHKILQGKLRSLLAWDFLHIQSLPYCPANSVIKHALKPLQTDNSPKTQTQWINLLESVLAASPVILDHSSEHDFTISILLCKLSIWCNRAVAYTLQIHCRHSSMWITSNSAIIYVKIYQFHQNHDMYIHNTKVMTICSLVISSLGHRNTNKYFSKKHIPPYGSLLTPKIRPSLGLSPQNKRRPVWDVAELQCRISRQSVKPQLRNLLLHKKKKGTVNFPVVSCPYYGMAE